MMSPERRQEIILLCVVGVLTALGMAVVCIAKGDRLMHATRGISVAALVICAGFLMDLVRGERDRILLPLVTMACGTGVVLLWHLDVWRSTKQVLWIMVGCIAMCAVYMLITDTRKLRRVKYVLGIAGVGLLIGPMLWTREQYATHVPVEVGTVAGFQVAEFAKVLILVSLVGFADDYLRALHRRGTSSRGPATSGIILPTTAAAILIASIVSLVIAQQVAVAVVLAAVSVAVVYLCAGRPVYTLVAVVAAAGIVVSSIAVFSHLGVRTTAWLHPGESSTGIGIRTLQGMFALAEGGLAGTGIGTGAPDHIPSAQTDMIFAVVGEELGLAGTCGLILVFALMAYSGFRIAWEASGRFGALLAAALTSGFALQQILLAAGITRVLPLAGGTMPFVSYGGTGMVSNFLAIGLLLAVSRDSRRHWGSRRPSPRRKLPW